MFETKEGVIKPIVYLGVIREEKLLFIDYVQAPNPAKNGWWIPAPGLKFGEDPTKKAETLLSDFGFSGTPPKLHNIESFVLPGGWHLIYHFICVVNMDIKPNKNIKTHKWVSADELENMKDLAHGKWEIEIGKSYLSRSHKERVLKACYPKHTQLMLN